MRITNKRAGIFIGFLAALSLVDDLFTTRTLEALIFKTVSMTLPFLVLACFVYRKKESKKDEVKESSKE